MSPSSVVTCLYYWASTKITPGKFKIVIMLGEKKLGRKPWKEGMPKTENIVFSLGCGINISMDSLALQRWLQSSFPHFAWSLFFLILPNSNIVIKSTEPFSVLHMHPFQ
jgi:hypothetical protein